MSTQLDIMMLKARDVGQNRIKTTSTGIGSNMDELLVISVPPDTIEEVSSTANSNLN